MNRIDLVLFDMNDVLMRYDKAARIRALAQASGRTPAEVEAAIWGSGYEDRGDAGDTDAEAYLAGFGAQLAYPLTLAEWCAALETALTPMHESLDLAARVARQCHVAVLTNNNLLVKREAARLVPEVDRIFGARFHVSAEFHARKPDPAAYRACLATLGIAAERALFIDDSAKNIAGAAQAGLATHLFTNAGALAQALHHHQALPRL